MKTLLGKYALIKVRSIQNGEIQQELHKEGPYFFIVKITKIDSGFASRDYVGDVIWYFNEEFNVMHFYLEDIQLIIGDVEPCESELENFDKLFPEYWI